MKNFRISKKIGSQAVQDITERIDKAFQLFFRNVKRKLRCSPPNLKKVKNYKEAFKCFKISAEIGNIDAMYYLGHLYNDGLGVDKSKELAKKWYQKSADGGKEKAKRILSNG